MQRWEYKHAVRSRWIRSAKALDGYEATDWDLGSEELFSFGKDGWELVSVTPRCSLIGGYQGFTNEELWVFKRPIET